jgi:hypothetical protein
LGDGTTTDRLTPVQVTGLSGMSAVSAGYWFNLALKNDGTVWAWGSNINGQLGDGTTTDRLSPAQVTGLAGITAISAGYYHSLALKSDGGIYGWGYNSYGELGDGTTAQRTSPVLVSGVVPAPLQAPSSLSATAATTTSVSLSWPAVTGATSYNVYWGSSPFVNPLGGTKIAGATSPYTHAPVTTGTRYYYVVTAVNANGESSASISANVKP